ncbi:cytosine permease [Acidiphilium sp. AL]|uniref:Cytosine permease n=1 Tax=Acidiphilium iwatense TaxID=768198 RepID=A0ABS9DZ80_9PROT|nr:MULTISPECIES: cytosine permease [Acidiphilium]MCF3946649.1 cytosine permease [Acidiphilium iwatense]MCU4159974.1 cytosine permease [Acidiphilium sp. AL]
MFERRAIDRIPETERHGRPASLFTLWFSANMQMTTVATGLVAGSLGLGLASGMVAIVLGNVLGGVFMAYHAAQGPKLGIPQMIQSRAQFGVLGANLPVFLVIILYLGFFTLSAILGGEAASALLGVPPALGIVIADIAAFVLLIFGYDLIHRYERIVALLFLLVFAIVTVVLIGDYHRSVLAAGKPAPVAMIVLGISIFATWQITYAPYVADYSRYLPAKTSFLSSSAYTYLGSVLASIWMMALGLVAGLIASKAANADTTLYFAGLLGSSWRWLMLLVILLGITAANVLNLYGSAMSAATILTSAGENGLTRKVLANGMALRIGVGALAAIIGSALAISASGNFVGAMTNFLLLLLYVFVPWTAINLTDFYLVRRGSYDIDAIYDPAGVYGTINWRTMAIYGIGILVEIPFMNADLYEGPIAKALGGADISWILGLIVPSVLYILANRRMRIQAVAR